MEFISWDGQPISAPGVYAGVPIDTYHQQLTVTPSVSSGGLRRIRQKSPAHYFAQSYLNPSAEPRVESEALIMGRAVHLLFGGEEGFRQQFCIRPDEYTDPKTGEVKPWNGNATVCKKWLGEAAREGLSVLKGEMVTAIRGMAASMAQHPTLKAGLLWGDVERSIVWQDEKTGIWLKARPDVLPTDSNMLVDLKTTADASPVAVRRDIADRGYHMQLALCIEGIKATTGRDITDAVLVFIEKSAPYAVNIKPLDQGALMWGHRENRAALDIFAQCLAEGVWPGYDDDEIPARLPQWYLKRLDEEAEAGGLPDLADC